MSKFKTVKDSMGELSIPTDALYQAQTQRAINNFKISNLTMPDEIIEALALIKQNMAEVNLDLGLLTQDKAKAIVAACEDILTQDFTNSFPVDVFQTGSGTSSNMNMNEVVATIANNNFHADIHPNDDVNMGQSSNDVIPTAIHISAYLAITKSLVPALDILLEKLHSKAKQNSAVVKNGRTHLMDAMPITLAQEIMAWHDQILQAKQLIISCLEKLKILAIGGTAVGTGINAHPKAKDLFVAKLNAKTKLDFKASHNCFLQISSQDAAVSISGQLKTLAVAIMKISNDLRWMNSGPLAGLSEISLPAIQPGSSIMPGKINPVIPEAVAMAAAQVIGNDTTITIGGQSGNFQLNVMLPIIGFNLIQSINILTTSCEHLAECIAHLTVNTTKIAATTALNPILITALNAKIGYEKGAQIAKTAYKNNLPILEVAASMTEIPKSELAKLLDPINLTNNQSEE